MTISPRYYQIDACAAVEKYIVDDGKAGSPLVVLPTGAGKSLVIGMLCRLFADHYGVRVAVLTHRKELIEQDARAIRSVWPEAPIGIYSAGLGEKTVDRITVAGIQSIWRKPSILGRVQIVIVDEAHLISTDDCTMYLKTLMAIADVEPDVRMIGLTATPYRLGQGYLTQGEGALFTSVCYSADVAKLVGEGYLSPLVPGVASAEIDTDALGIRGGEYVLSDLEMAADIEEITDAVADDVAAQIAQGRTSALLYGVSVQHAGHLRNALLLRGVSCELVTGQSTPTERARALERFKRRELQAIASCDVLTTGFDAPCVDVIALVRATCSPGLYVQILGRGMRLADGKRDCVVLDYGGNIARHGPITAIRPPKEKREAGESEAPYKVCKTCLAEVPTSTRVCPECDSPFPLPERKANARPSRLHPLAPPDNPTQAVVDVPVSQVEYYKHRKKDDPDAKPTLRVDYYARDQMAKVCSEWVCIEHDVGSFARQKAEEWWAVVVGGQCPHTVEDALKILDNAPQVIVSIKTKIDGDWMRVIGKTIDQLSREAWDDEKMRREDAGAPDAPSSDGFFDDDYLPF